MRKADFRETDADSKGYMGNPAGGTGRPGVLPPSGPPVDGQDRPVAGRSWPPTGSRSRPLLSPAGSPSTTTRSPSASRTAPASASTTPGCRDNLSQYWGVNCPPSCTRLRARPADHRRGPGQRLSLPAGAAPTTRRTCGAGSSGASTSTAKSLSTPRPSTSAKTTSGQAPPHWLPDVPEKTLLHEFGHCTGLPHREDEGYQGSMYPMMLYYPNADETVPSTPNTTRGCSLPDSAYCASYGDDCLGPPSAGGSG